MAELCRTGEVALSLEAGTPILRGTGADGLTLTAPIRIKRRWGQWEKKEREVRKDLPMVREEWKGPQSWGRGKGSRGGGEIEENELSDRGASAHLGEDGGRCAERSHGWGAVGKRA